MKILFFTDTHIRGNNPTNRKDVFVDSLEEKIIEIKNIIKEEKIDFILHGGDLFDRPDISLSVVNRFVKILGDMGKPIYLISGNHDIYGHNPKTVERTVISLLDTLGIVRLVNAGEEIVLEKDGLRVQLTGQPYTFAIDGENRVSYYSPKEVREDVDYSIHMVHGLLLDKPFLKTVDHTLVDEIKEMKADILLCGHYHSGLDLININNKYFINPGSIARITNSIAEMKRRPKLVIIQLEKNKDIEIEMRSLNSAKPGNEVLDREKIENAVFKGERLYEFKQIIEGSLDFEKMDINDVLLEVSNIAQVEEEVKKEALRRIGEIQIREMENK